MFFPFRFRRMSEASPAGVALASLACVVAMFSCLCGCQANQPAAPRALPAPAPPAAHAAKPSSVRLPHIDVPTGVMTGLDVLESGDFLLLRGKRIGLLTHPAGADRHGQSAIDVLRRAPGVRLVALFGTEHGVYGTLPASKIYDDQIDPRTGLRICSLYNGHSHQPTRAQLAGLDALVIDLQDIGVRTYTFAGAMKQAMEGCFENNVEVIVLDRPNPLGGLKVDGPPIDPEWLTRPALVNEFPVPYVHGMTIGELAEFAKDTPGVLRVSEAVRRRGRLTVVPMSGWRRAMRWPETGLSWIRTSEYIPDFSAVVGCPMTGLCAYVGHFSSGVGNQYPFRGIYNPLVKSETVKRELDALHIPGLQFRWVSAPNQHTGKPAIGLYIEVVDWDEWRPTELNFQLMRLACKLEPRNPFLFVSKGESEVFLRHMGSTAFYRDISAHGSGINVAAYVAQWQAEARAFQDRMRRFWLYR
jgi:uncharacterized protein YbbC (DUF1343 family)